MLFTGRVSTQKFNSFSKPFGTPGLYGHAAWSCNARSQQVKVSTFGLRWCSLNPCLALRCSCGSCAGPGAPLLSCDPPSEHWNATCPWHGEALCSPRPRVSLLAIDSTILGPQLGRSDKESSRRVSKGKWGWLPVKPIGPSRSGAHLELWYLRTGSF